MADLAVFAKFVVTRLYGHLRSRSLQENVVLWLHFKCILIRRGCNFRQGVFEAPIVGSTFLSIFPWSCLGKISENGRFRCLCQICHNSALRHLRSCSLQQNVVLCLHFKSILTRRGCNWRQGFFEAPIVGLLFWAISLGPHLAKAQKMADLAVFAKFVITRLYGHLRSRSLQENVVLCLHFKCILIRRGCNLR